MRPIALILMLATLAGCHAAPMPLGAAPRLAQRAAIRDLGPIGELARTARADLDTIDQTFHALALDTAAGRKITTKREGPLTVGLGPLLQQLDADMTSIATRLAAIGTPEATALQAELDRHHPLAGETMPMEATASDMLYRVTQYRLKLAALVEFDLRQAAPVTP